MEIRASTDHREAPTMYTAPTTALLGSAATIAVTHPAYDHCTHLTHGRHPRDLERWTAVLVLLFPIVSEAAITLPSKTIAAFICASAFVTEAVYTIPPPPPPVPKADMESQRPVMPRPAP